MLGRKLVPVRNGKVAPTKHTHPFVPEIQKIKHLTFKNAKKYEHLALVAIIRFSVRSSNFLKNSYQEIKIKIKDIINKDKNHPGQLENREASKFLKMISDYKDKIRHIKHKIKEEEENS